LRMMQRVALPVPPFTFPTTVHIIPMLVMPSPWARGEAAGAMGGKGASGAADRAAAAHKQAAHKGKVAPKDGTAPAGHVSVGSQLWVWKCGFIFA